MDTFEQQAAALKQRISRKVQLEDTIPQLQIRRAELSETIPWLRTDLAAAKFDADKLENPGFFLRLFGNIEEKLVNARKAVKDATIAYDAAVRSLAELEERIHKDASELESLSGCREEYLRFLDQHCEDSRSVIWKEQFLCSEAICAVSQVIDALSGAHPSMVTDVRFRGVYEGNRKMEFLAAADQYAQTLRELLEQFSHNPVTIGASLHAPSAYVNSASMENAQLDRLNIAIDQARKAKSALREYLSGLDAS